MTDKPCARCKERPRNPKRPYCDVCWSQYQREWNQRNPEKHGRNVFVTNTMRQITGKRAEWRKRTGNASQKKWEDTHREERNAYRRERYAQKRHREQEHENH